MDTYGNSGNEGRRGYDGDYDGGNTYGAQGNEPSRHHGSSGRNGDNDSTHPSQNGSVPNSRGNNGRNGHNDSTYPSQNGGMPNARGGYPNTGGRNTGGNEPSRHGPYHPNTYGPYGNESARHRNIEVLVQPPSNRNRVSMTANLDWTLDTLHSSCARSCHIDPSQCFSSCNGKPVSGRDKVHETKIQDGSIINLNVRVRGG